LLLADPVHVGIAALGCPAEQGSAGFFFGRSTTEANFADRQSFYYTAPQTEEKHARPAALYL
jgi:hypothetical protein